jgi:hypothetical protein
MSGQLECRVVVTEHDDGQFSLGMYDPVTGRHEALGRHPNRDRERVIGDLKRSIEQAGHRLTISVVSGRSR